MQFKDGADVVTSDGNRVGKIDRVVLKPATMEVTHVVVHSGLVFTEDKVVPVSMIGHTTEERVTLRPDADDLAQLPDYQETDYIEVTADDDAQDSAEDDGSGPRSVLYYPSVGMLRPPPFYAEYEDPQYVATVETNIPEDTVALQEGASVISSDGEQVGNIERIFTEPINKQATHFIVSQGLILKARTLIPTDWLSTVDEYEVHLSVDAAFVKRLPEYQLPD